MPLVSYPYYGWVWVQFPRFPVRQLILLQKGKGKGKGNGKGNCNVKGKGKIRIEEENTVIGRDKHGDEIHCSSKGDEKAEVEVERQHGKAAAEKGDEKAREEEDLQADSDAASRMLRLALERFTEERRLHYQEFEWHV